LREGVHRVKASGLYSVKAIVLFLTAGVVCTPAAAAEDMCGRSEETGYLPPRHLYKEKGYEVESSRFAPDAADMVVKQALEMLYELH